MLHCLELELKDEPKIEIREIDSPNAIHSNLSHSLVLGHQPPISTQIRLKWLGVRSAARLSHSLESRHCIMYNNLSLDVSAGLNSSILSAMKEVTVDLL